MKPRSVISNLADYSVKQAGAALAPDVVHAAKRVTIDWMASLFAGVDSDLARALRTAHAHELGVGRASVLGQGTTAFPATAAWINGSTSHVAEFDDIFRDAIYHPGCPTISAALATAEHAGAPGMQFLKAVTVGYEISTRLGAAVQPDHYKFFHTTGTIGCFGAAAAAAVLIAPDSSTASAHALATSATFASGLQQAFRSDAMTKALHAGHAAWVGVTSAQNAASGVTGVLDILEGPVGFVAAMGGRVDWDKATDALGERFNIEAVTLKAHGCCGHTFAAIDAMLALRNSGRFGIADIDSISVATYKVAIDVAGIADPRSSFECKFSIPYVLAHAMKFGSVRLSAFDPQRIGDAEIRHLMPRISLVEDGALSAAFPGRRAARVSVKLKSGEVLEHFAPYRQGDPESPLTDAQLEDKFKELAEPVLGERRAAALLQDLWKLDTLGSVRDLRLSTAA